MQGVVVKVVAIVPARLAASRFPGKPMALITGMPMIGHCWHRTRITSGVEETYVATCDREIFDYIESLGGKAIMTSTKHNRATDRTGEALFAAEKDLGHKADVVIMMQGDEPLIMPDAIASLLPAFDDPQVEISNLMGEFKTEEAFLSKNTVKVVTNSRGEALYFSREPIPCTWKNTPGLPKRQQLGIMAFRREALIRFNQSPETILEQCESVDMNRVLEYGGRIRMVPTALQTIGVDTPDDLAAAERRMANDALHHQYVGQ
jgi:3-deoxy-manno-octulosonate cytidylyltransferase (CMP-KDO synthetase)